MRLFKAVSSALLTALLIVLLNTKFGDVPPIGAFLNPVTGFWQNAEAAQTSINEEMHFSELKQGVTIKYDKNRIPHIFAENDHDLYFAQGYVVARDRLWEMDIQTRTAAGRLAEVIGKKALSTDRFHRRIGMTYGAEKSFSTMMKDPQVREMLYSYAEGVNAYIHQLSPKDYPLEFKLLDYKPEEFKAINCVFFLKLMCETLTAGSHQFAMGNNLKKFGLKTVNELFPDHAYFEDPIIPRGEKWPFTPMKTPDESPAVNTEKVNDEYQPKIPGIGSNNWVVSGSKTKTNFPILANDPHLHLTYPSIWYQIQLQSKTVNVDGVCFAGVPGVIIGFNNHITWGVTNVNADVRDWYRIAFKDTRRNFYRYNHTWKDVARRIETIKVRGGATVVDTVLYTHHGPVVYLDSVENNVYQYKKAVYGHALRWIAHEPSNEFRTFFMLNRAKTYIDYKNAMAYYTAPAQNFIFADKEKNIAITSSGKFPLKYRNQGKFVLNGSDPRDDWHGWILNNQNPSIKNPSSGYLFSANQSPVNSSYPYYLGWQFEPDERARRIHEQLEIMRNADIESMRALQMDNFSILAKDVLTKMITDINKAQLNNRQKQALSILSQWNKRFDVNSIGASIFAVWWKKFSDLTWDDDFDSKMYRPSLDRTKVLLLQDPRAKWFDRKDTRETETSRELLNLSFRRTIDSLNKDYGPLSDKWSWGKVKTTHIDHVAGIPGLGTGNFVTGGNTNVINALAGGHGPSWRMVVQMGPNVEAFGIFPGGESGNPGSFYYDNMFEHWKNGRLNKILFLQNKSEKPDQIVGTLRLLNKK